MHGNYVNSDTNYIAWRADTSAAAFANGNVAYHAEGGAWAAETDDDFLFALLEDPAGVDYYRDGSSIKIADDNLTADYYTNIKDIGYICDARILISAIITTISSLSWNLNPLARWNDNVLMRFTGEESPGSCTFQIRTSTDNVTWSNWEDWISADYTCRYFQIKMTFTRKSPTTEIAASNLTVEVDLPDVDEKGTGEVTVAADGAEITFTKTFHEAPDVNISILSGDGYVHKFSVAPTTTGFPVKLYELDGTLATGTFSYHAHGT